MRPVLILKYLVLFLFIGAGLSLLMYVVEKNTALELSFDILSKDTTKVQVFFDTGSGFQENKKFQDLVTKEKNKAIHLTLPASTKQIRIDPATSETEVRINSLQLKRTKHADAHNISSDCLELNRELQLVAHSDAILQLQVIGPDPQILISQKCLPESRSKIFIPTVAPGILLLSLIGVLLVRVSENTGQRVLSRTLYLVIGIVLLQSLCIVTFTEFNSHPDEHSHVIASKYYQDHWFKMQADQPAMKNSLIPSWGFSYLFLPDIVYFLAEKTTVFLSIAYPEPHTRYRFFNFFLFCTLVVVFSKGSRNGLYFLLALGLSPQIWYIFSYFNGDAFSLFSSLLLGYFFVRQREQIQSFFWVRPSVNRWIVVFGVLCCMVLLARLQYAIFVFYLLALLLILKPTGAKWTKIPRVIVNISLFFACILIFIGAMELKEQHANNFKKSEIIAAVTEEAVTRELSKSEILETGYNPYNVYLRDLGVPLTSLLTKHPWLKDSIQSLLGVYGWLTFPSSNLFYWISGIFGFGGIVLLLLSSAWWSNLQYKAVLLYTFLAILAVFIQSLCLSWTVGFQPQGRYLFAIIPILAVTLCINSTKISMPMLYGFTLVLYLINSIGFTIYGIIPLFNL